MDIPNSKVNKPSTSEYSPGTHPVFTVTCKDLSKRFNREWIFKGLDYHFSSGTTYVITGPNGSGKSTLLQVLWGQVPPTSGTLEYRHNNIPINADEIWQHISIAAPYMELVDEFTLQEQVQFHYRLKKAVGGMHPKEIIERMYLEHAKDKQIGNFSSGMRQRVKLALALYTAADLIFLDEPSTNLDRQAFEWYKNEVRNLPANSTLFIASNNPEEYPADATTLNVMDLKPRL